MLSREGCMYHHHQGTCYHDTKPKVELASAVEFSFGQANLCVTTGKLWSLAWFSPDDRRACFARMRGPTKYTQLVCYCIPLGGTINVMKYIQLRQMLV